ncbi:hypothetical protein C7S18_19085 [Ahniella affigens]|uniref:Uncharacterized protein n=1 Tax=Ahniella affigens TaxID=2021234 RepID=A0A2P1PWC2_9GAMM|nr:hypothetical protein C7S18_19085 [Ahniella affigens]
MSVCKAVILNAVQAVARTRGWARLHRNNHSGDCFAGAPSLMHLTRLIVDLRVNRKQTHRHRQASNYGDFIRLNQSLEALIQDWIDVRPSASSSRPIWKCE